MLLKYVFEALGKAIAMVVVFFLVVWLVIQLEFGKRVKRAAK